LSQLCELTVERTAFSRARPGEAFPTRVTVYRDGVAIARLVDDLDHDSEVIAEYAVKAFNATNAEVIHEGMFVLPGADFESSFTEALVHRTIAPDGTTEAIALPFRRLTDHAFAWFTPVRLDDTDGARRPFAAAAAAVLAPHFAMTPAEQRESDRITAIALTRLGVGVVLLNTGDREPYAQPEQVA